MIHIMVCELTLAVFLNAFASDFGWLAPTWLAAFAFPLLHWWCGKFGMGGLFVVSFRFKVN